MNIHYKIRHICKKKKCKFKRRTKLYNNPVEEHILALRKSSLVLNKLTFNAKKALHKLEKEGNKAKQITFPAKMFPLNPLPAFPKDYPFQKKHVPKKRHNVRLKFVGTLTENAIGPYIENFVHRVLQLVGFTGIESINTEASPNCESHTEAVNHLTDLTMKFLKYFVTTLKKYKNCEKYKNKEDLWNPLQATLFEIKFGGIKGLHQFYHENIVRKHDLFVKGCMNNLQKYQKLRAKLPLRKEDESDSKINLRGTIGSLREKINNLKKKKILERKRKLKEKRKLIEKRKQLRKMRLSEEKLCKDKQPKEIYRQDKNFIRNSVKGPSKIEEQKKKEGVTGKKKNVSGKKKNVSEKKNVGLRNKINITNGRKLNKNKERLDQNKKVIFRIRNQIANKDSFGVPRNKAAVKCKNNAKAVKKLKNVKKGAICIQGEKGITERRKGYIKKTMQNIEDRNNSLNKIEDTEEKGKNIRKENKSTQRNKVNVSGNRKSIEGKSTNSEVEKKSKEIAKIKRGRKRFEEILEDTKKNVARKNNVSIGKQHKNILSKTKKGGKIIKKVGERNKISERKQNMIKRLDHIKKMIFKIKSRCGNEESKGVPGNNKSIVKNKNIKKVSKSENVEGRAICIQGENKITERKGYIKGKMLNIKTRNINLNKMEGKEEIRKNVRKENKSVKKNEINKKGNTKSLGGKSISSEEENKSKEMWKKKNKGKKKCLEDKKESNGLKNNVNIDKQCENMSAKKRHVSRNKKIGAKNKITKTSERKPNEINTGQDHIKEMFFQIEGQTGKESDDIAQNERSEHIIRNKEGECVPEINRAVLKNKNIKKKVQQSENVEKKATCQQGEKEITERRTKYIGEKREERNIHLNEIEFKETAKSINKEKKNVKKNNKGNKKITEGKYISSEEENKRKEIEKRQRGKKEANLEAKEKSIEWENNINIDEECENMNRKKRKGVCRKNKVGVKNKTTEKSERKPNENNTGQDHITETIFQIEGQSSNEKSEAVPKNNKAVVKNKKIRKVRKSENVEKRAICIQGEKEITERKKEYVEEKMQYVEDRNMDLNGFEGKEETGKNTKKSAEKIKINEKDNEKSVEGRTVNAEQKNKSKELEKKEKKRGKRKGLEVKEKSVGWKNSISIDEQCQNIKEKGEGLKDKWDSEEVKYKNDNEKDEMICKIKSGGLNKGLKIKIKRIKRHEKAEIDNESIPEQTKSADVKCESAKRKENVKIRIKNLGQNYRGTEDMNKNTNRENENTNVESTSTEIKSNIKERNSEIAESKGKSEIKSKHATVKRKSKEEIVRSSEEHNRKPEVSENVERKKENSKKFKKGERGRKKKSGKKTNRSTENEDFQSEEENVQYEIKRVINSDEDDEKNCETTSTGSRKRKWEHTERIIIKRKYCGGENKN